MREVIVVIVMRVVRVVRVVREVLFSSDRSSNESR